MHKKQVLIGQLQVSVDTLFKAKALLSRWVMEYNTGTAHWATGRLRRKHFSPPDKNHNHRGFSTTFDIELGAGHAKSRN